MNVIHSIQAQIFNKLWIDFESGNLFYRTVDKQATLLTQRLNTRAVHLAKDMLL